MKTSQFEAIKIAVKQDKEGYVLTLRMHPDEVPEEILRDFVGARYQVVMVRLDTDEQPMVREFHDRSVKIAGLLCRDSGFWAFLNDRGEILEAEEREATSWLRDYLGIQSRSELKTNPQARDKLDLLHKEYQAWQQNE